MASSALPLAAFDGFRRLPPAQKMGLAAGLALLASVVAAWWMWSQQPDYQVLYANLADRDGGAVVGALAQMNVPYKVGDGGGSILVPGAQVHDLRLKLASQGLPKGSVAGFELLDGQKLGATQFQEQVAFQRGLEGELARSIQTLAAVKAARVHLAIPRSTSFLRDAQKPTASVLLNLHSGKTLDRAQVAGIVHLVASSVPELNPRSVSILDQSGALLSALPGDGGALDAAQLNYVRDIEGSLARRIEDIIEPLVGRTNVRAQVTADVDFSTLETSAESFKPNGTPAESAIRSQTLSEKPANATEGAGGIVGSVSNQPNAKPGTAAAASNAAKEATQKDSTTQYEVDRMVKRERHPTGNVKRLSAAVIVNHMSKTDDEGKVTQVALPAEVMEQVKALAREALGFNEKRGDTLNVTHAPFVQEAAVAPIDTPFWKDPGNISMAKELGKSAAIGLGVLWLVLGVLRPLMRRLADSAPIPGAAEAQLLEAPHGTTIEGADSIQNVRALARQDPRMVANVVKTWVSGS